MRSLDTAEWLLVGFCSGLGLTWTLLAFFAAFTLNAPGPALDPLGIVRGIMYWPVIATLLAGSWLYNIGVHENDLIPLAGAIGIVAGALAGIVAVAATRRYL